eukprot:2462245-Rhodomonas_salina.1
MLMPHAIKFERNNGRLHDVSLFASALDSDDVAECIRQSCPWNVLANDKSNTPNQRRALAYRLLRRHTLAATRCLPVFETTMLRGPDLAERRDWRSMITIRSASVA